MAVIKKNGSTMGIPMNITRGNPIPLDSTTVWYSLQEAQEYAQHGATAYVGQLISVVDETNDIATVYQIQNEAGDLLNICTQSAIPVAQVNSDWTATSGMAQILNKPSITSGTGEKSINEGRADQNIASGQYSHAEGAHTTASGSSAHAEGEYTTASNNASHAEGYNTIASGIYGHAEGCYTTASGSNSHAEGLNTVATKANQHVFGTYNIYEGGSSSEKGVYIEVVGNGGTENTRSNARTLDWNGNEILSGKLTVGTAPTNDMDVTTKTYVDTNLNLKAPLASPSLTGTPIAPTAQTGTNTTQIATTAFVKNTIDSLGLTGAMRFKGTATVEITDGSTTNPIISGYDWNEKQLGDVVLYDGKEFVWTSLFWEMLGPDTSFKIQQSVVADPSASGTATAFISSISQDTNGNITATKANLPTSISAKDITISTYGDNATASLRITEGSTVPLNVRLTTKPTQSTTGLVEIQLGSGTSAGYKGTQGKLSIYDTAGYSSVFYHSSNLTANRTYSLPDATGTLALLESPAFTGTPTAPTAAADTNNTQIATTAFVKTLLSDIESALDDKLEEDDVYLANEAERHFMALTTIPSTDATHVPQGQLYASNDKLYWKTAAIPSSASAQIALTDTQTVTLAVNDWNTTIKSQTVNVTGVTTTNTVIVSTAPSSFEDGMNAQIYCSAQGTGTLTFSYLGDLPSGTITMNILILD